jgi:archaetidylinositol phosphate synthase
MKEIKSHERVNDILLGPLERPALKWLSEHMPAWMTPDLLSLIGIVGSVVTFASYWLASINKNFLWLACMGFLINWFGDSLDGTVARYRHIERPQYGFFLDHTVDSVSMVLVFTGLGLSGYISFGIASMALVGYLLMSIMVYLTTAVQGVYRISYSRLGPTEIRLVAIIFTILLYFVGNPSIQFSAWAISLGNLLCGLVALVLFVFFFTGSIRQARELNKIDNARLKSEAGKRTAGRKSRTRVKQNPAGKIEY